MLLLTCRVGNLLSFEDEGSWSMEAVNRRNAGFLRFFLLNSFPNSKVSFKTLKKNSSLFLIISFTFSALKFVS